MSAPRKDNTKGYLSYTDMYDSFCEEHPKHKLSRREYRKLITLINDGMVDQIIKGKGILLSGGLGTLAIVRIKRDFRDTFRRVDWKATNDYHKEHAKEGEKMKIIYCTDDFYVRWLWTIGRKRAKLKNSIGYYFKATKSKWDNTGSNNRMVASLRNDPLLYGKLDLYEYS